MNTAQDVHNLERFIEVLARIFAMPYEMIESSIARYYRAYKEERGIDALTDWVNKGKDLSHVEVFADNIDELAYVFKLNHVPYVVLNTVLGDESPIATIVFRDKDTKVVDDIIKGYRSFLSEKTRELDIHSFRSIMDEAEIATAKNLTVGEIYAFRKAMQNENFLFCVGKDTKNEGRYQIFADDKAGLFKVLAGMSYDMNIAEGEYKAKVDKYSNQHKKIYEMLGKESFYLVDGSEPTNFTYVQKDKYSIHSLVINKERQPDGKVLEVVSDPAPKVSEELKAKNLFKIAMTYKKPMLVRVEDFNLVKGYTRKGMAKEAEDFDIKYKQMVKDFENKKPSLIKFPRKKSFAEREKLIGYVNLPQTYLKDIAEQFPDVYIHFDGTIAFKKEDKKGIDTYLNEQLESMDLAKKQEFLDSLEDSGNSAIAYLEAREEQNRLDFIERMKDKDATVSSELESARTDFLKIQMAALTLDKKVFKELQTKHVAKELDNEIDI